MCRAESDHVEDEDGDDDDDDDDDDEEEKDEEDEKDSSRGSGGANEHAFCVHAKERRLVQKQQRGRGGSEGWSEGADGGNLGE